MIGIVVAIRREAQLLESVLEHCQVRKQGYLRIATGHMDGQKSVVVTGGVGKVSSALATAVLIQQERPSQVIQAGIAGSLDRQSLRIGDVAIPSRTFQYDVDLPGLRLDFLRTSHRGQVVYEVDQDLLNCIKASLATDNWTWRLRFDATLITGDRSVKDRELARQLHRIYHAGCVDMEGAAVAQVAKFFDVPFLLVKAISDYADSTTCDPRAFSAYRGAASNALVCTLREIVKICSVYLQQMTRVNSSSSCPQLRTCASGSAY